ncbi:DUF427 domain-containing protein [Sphingomonas bacterium]|uniref:DUF427 domain-containing protein n=1 Tax=Sphingomonas bacterium TaxID=1895847 RepID=UPI00157521DC|nr:DUF427 domain-containing protein [Sphingomonas bacterium]
MHPDPIRPGEESVWDYPRPAIAQPNGRHVRIEHRGTVVADTRVAFRVLEISHPAGWYLPPGSIATGALLPYEQRSFCEWKGVAVYWHLAVGGEVLHDVAWSYPTPTAAFAGMVDHVAFYAASLDRCTVDGEVVRPQAGGFYGGWITADLGGPFKGAPGSAGW